jgi:probable phosphoglycerate mutase
VTIYFVRHGETDWNATRRYQGQEDIAINARGRQQARRNGEALRVLLPAIAAADFVASPLGRTRETMHILRTALGLPPGDYRTDQRLVELHYGHWQGQLQSDLPRLDPEGIAARAADPFHWRPEGGESYVDLSRRLEAWLGTVSRDSVVVSHGGVSRALRCLLVDGISEADVPALEVPQDRILVLADGAMRWM